MLESFKIKPLDLEPVYAAWPAATRFLGDPKKDPPVDEWLEEIKRGCVERNVPKEYWHSCAQHFMGEQAKARLVELKKVMAQVHGGHYRWNWKKYKVAMRNMSWDIDTSETKTVKGPLWWLPRSPKPEEQNKQLVAEPMPILSRANTLTRLFNKEPEPEPAAERPAIARAATTQTSSFWPVRKDSKGPVASGDTVQRPVPRKAKSDGAVMALSSDQVSKALPSLPNSGDVSAVRAPAWLLNAATALDFLTNEHPRVMSTLSAILIVAGTIPALPGIAAGAGGAVLASSTVHAVGAIAIGLGNWMHTQQEISKAQQEKHVA
ncbi:hypothetical protein B0H15DRAFT_814555 [Mycena belliarum]|uniref:Uncharacterized protein n=1 Tax=Mycena belliarum TaxID=1033014 RepID=A0AAD6UG80_9AGAR|nr:hypothetical protein B0H15DRAFT_814555 [Mycena belliae]